MGATNRRVRTKERGEQSVHAEGAEPCVAANDAITLIRDKWTILVLGALGRAKGPLRYKEIERRVEGISQRMLTLTLRALEENGLATRTIFATVPPRVDYELTTVGRTLIAPLRALLDWSIANREAIAEARRAYVKRAD